MPDPEPPTTITDVAVMRALAHPARLALLDHLTSSGPATATECAGIVSLTPSATSYHLRALAKAGMVEEAPGRGDGRERFWRSTVAGYTVEGGPDPDPVVREAKRELLDSFLVWEETQVRQYLARVDVESKEWQDASAFNGTVLLVSVEELRHIGKAIADILRPYRKRDRTDPPAGARTVATMFRGFPTDTPLPD
jgi:DNA-binding transcriptional ArsR family regulator